QSSGDVIHVDITGNTVTFTYSSGGGITNTFQAMADIYFQPDVFGGPNSISSASSPYTLVCGTASGTGSCPADGFSINPAGAKYSTPSASSGPSTATFTFAANVVAGLTSSDFDVHVSYSGNCSGFVDGTLKGSATSDSNCTPGTPVPEPMTVFLG